MMCVVVFMSIVKAIEAVKASVCRSVFPIAETQMPSERHKCKISIDKNFFYVVAIFKLKLNTKVGSYQQLYSNKTKVS